MLLLAVAGLLLVGLLASALAARAVLRTEERRVVDEFSFASDQVTDLVEGRVEAYALILRAAAGVFLASDEVTRDEWRVFVEQLDVDNVVPGGLGIGVARLVAGSDLRDHIESVRDEGFPDYDVTPAGVRDLHAPVVFLEPFDARNARAFGYDALTDPVRRAAMDQARDTGRATLTGRVTLVQETGVDVQAGTILYMPVYRQGAPVTTEEERRAALTGWTYTPFRMDELLSGVLRGGEDTAGPALDLRLYDAAEPRPDALLFGDDAPPPGDDALLDEVRRIDRHGRTWTLLFTEPPGSSAADTSAAWRTFGAGVVLTVLLTALVASLLGTRARALRIAGVLTEDIRASEAELRDSEYRWRFAVEGHGDGLWDWNVPEGRAFYSPRWKAMLGHTDDEIGDGFDEWRRRVHPDDLDDAITTLDAALRGDVPSYTSEHRLRRRDGSFVWVVSRGVVVERAEDGSPVRVIGTHEDITGRRQAAERIEQLSRLYRALSACNAAIVRCSSEDELFARICEVVVRDGGMAMAWVGLVEESTQVVQPVEWFGEGTDYLDGIVISVDGDDPNGLGPTGTSVRENRPIWLDRYPDDERVRPWRLRAEPYGWQSSASLPLCRSGTPIGALTMYSTTTTLLDPEIRSLIAEVAADVSFALDKFGAEAATVAYQAHLVEADERFRSLVEQSVTGSFIVQNGRIVYANPQLKAMLGYDPDDHLVGADASILVPDDERPAALERLEALASGSVPRVDARFRALRKDGSAIEVVASSTRSTYHQRPAVIGLIHEVVAET